MDYVIIYLYINYELIFSHKTHNLGGIGTRIHFLGQKFWSIRKVIDSAFLDILCPVTMYLSFIIFYIKKITCIYLNNNIMSAKNISELNLITAISCKIHILLKLNYYIRFPQNFTIKRISESRARYFLYCCKLLTLELVNLFNREKKEPNPPRFKYTVCKIWNLSTRNLTIFSQNGRN